MVNVGNPNWMGPARGFKTILIYGARHLINVIRPRVSTSRVPLFHCSTVRLFHCSTVRLFHCSTVPKCGSRCSRVIHSSSRQSLVTAATLAVFLTLHNQWSHILPDIIFAFGVNKRGSPSSGSSGTTGTGLKIDNNCNAIPGTTSIIDRLPVTGVANNDISTNSTVSISIQFHNVFSMYGSLLSLSFPYILLPALGDYNSDPLRIKMT